MDFAEVFGDTAYLAKVLEGRWFYGTSGNPRGVQRRPFLARNLSYIRAGRNPESVNAAAHQQQESRYNGVAVTRSSGDGDDDDHDNESMDTRSVVPERERVAFERFCQASRDRVRKVMHHSASSPGVQRKLQIMWRNMDVASRRTWVNEEASDTKPAAKPSAKPVAKPAPTKKSKPSTMFFHFVYGSEDGYPVFQTEKRKDRHCPFCLQNAITDGGIVMHCNAFHGELHTFEAARTEDGNLHVVAKLNSQAVFQGSADVKDFVFCRSKEQRQLVLEVPFVTRTKQKAATLSWEEREKMMNLLMKRGAPPALVDKFKPCGEVPLRLYHHLESALPMIGEEWKVDDDNCLDENWRDEVASRLIDDFVDLMSEEKRFLKLWNNFIRIKSSSTIPDHVIPARCLEFVEKCASEIQQWNLRNELLLHLMNFWDYGLISGDNVLQCLALYDRLRSEAQPNLTEYPIYV